MDEELAALADPAYKGNLACPAGKESALGGQIEYVLIDNLMMLTGCVRDPRDHVP